MKKKLLLVTFLVDLGNKTFENRFIKLFENRQIMEKKFATDLVLDDCMSCIFEVKYL